MSETETTTSVRLEIRPSRCELTAERVSGGALIALVQSAGGRETGRVAVEVPAAYANWFGQQLMALCPAPVPPSPPAVTGGAATGVPADGGEGAALSDAAQGLSATGAG